MLQDNYWQGHYLGSAQYMYMNSILLVIRSGEEGTYPDLIEFTEKRLQNVNPKR